MINRSLFIHTFRASLRQPAYLFAATLIVAIFGLAMVGMHVESDRGRISELALFGTPIQNPYVFFHEILPQMLRLLVSAALFLSILSSTALSSTTISEPHFPIVLTRTPSRRSVFFSIAAGHSAAQELLIAGAGMLAAMISALKLDTGLTPEFLSVFGLVALDVWMIASLSFLTAVILDGSIAGAIAVGAAVFVLSPLLSSMDGVSHPVVARLTLFVPPFGPVERAIQSALEGRMPDPRTWLSPIACGCLLLVPACLLFEKREW